uniref:Late nodulin n=1 Tax=Vicia faba TaxID=3906 RepID=Q9LEF7_VICFA|nr:late nodulin [Vicia faba]
MAKNTKFVYAIVLFFSLFLLSIEANTGLRCEIDEDCPRDVTILEKLSYIYKCFDKECIVFTEAP